jgi:hypothetical protein
VERQKSFSYVGFYPAAADVWSHASHGCTWSHGSGRSTRSKSDALREVLDWIWTTHGMLMKIPQPQWQQQREAQEALHREEHGECYLKAPTGAAQAQPERHPKRRRM